MIRGSNQLYQIDIIAIIFLKITNIKIQMINHLQHINLHIISSIKISFYAYYIYMIYLKIYFIDYKIYIKY